MIYLVQCDQKHVYIADDRQPQRKSVPPLRCKECDSCAVRVWKLHYDSLSAVVRARKKEEVKQ